MEERREINRIEFRKKSVIVVCETEEKIYVDVKDVSPLGMGIIMPAGSPDLVGKDIIIVVKTLIMYATVTRMVEQEDGTYEVGIQAKEFSDEVLQYLFEHIG
ncbi:MAG: PilZ domain-containing protein [Lachnospiraceae bacterium]|nr:PilZ domain-containing protein [Agathobacter sp.]MDD6290356.1 PilZ domain-containing protein [Lachnospiraceae bacterium]